MIAYCMKKNRLKFKNAIQYVRNIRPNICPNLGFELQLKKYEAELGLESYRLERKKSTLQEGERFKRVGFLPSANRHESSHSSQNKAENRSVFRFDPNFKSSSSNRQSEKKVLSKKYPRTKPKEQMSNNFKRFYEVVETKLYVSGKGASRED